MRDEEFYEIYNKLTSNVANNANYVCLAYQDTKGVRYPDITAVTEKRNKDVAISGYKELKIECNTNEVNVRRVIKIIETKFAQQKYKFTNDFIIDYRFLENKEIIAFLQRGYQAGYFNKLRILGEDYTLDEETYEEIKEFDSITVNDTKIHKKNIKKSSRVFDLTIGINSNIESEINFFIKENPTKHQLRNLVNVINSEAAKKKINIKFYNPAEAVELIERLEELGLNEDVVINILGYPLIENSDIYNKLNSISEKRKIEVTYTCCDEILKKYSSEPFLTDNFYYSEIEPGGIIEYKDYIKMLKIMSQFEKKVMYIQSNTEIVMTAYEFLRTRNEYDKEAELLMNGKLADFLSLLCRRVGIPMFTFNSHKNKQNIARIIEKDPDGNIIFDKICTFDPVNDITYIAQLPDGSKQKRLKKDSYTYFGINPESLLHNSSYNYITLASSLTLSKDDISEYGFLSGSPVSSNYIGFYSPRLYAKLLLNLMGYQYNSKKVDINDLLIHLHNEERIGAIPEKYIVEVAKNLTSRKIIRDLGEEDVSKIKRSIDDRIKKFNQKTKIVYLNKFDNRDIKVTTFEDVELPNINIDLSKIDIARIYDEQEEILKVVNVEPIIIDQAIIEEKMEDVKESTPEDKFEETFNQSPEIEKTSESKAEIAIVSTGGSISIKTEKVDETETEKKSKPKNESSPKKHPTKKDYSKENKYGFTEKDFGEGYIAGTTIRVPRYREIYETDDEYLIFLKNYYEYYFPTVEEKLEETYHLTKDQIIQDFPINDRTDKAFKTEGSAQKYNSAYHFTKDQIIQDFPINEQTGQAYRRPSLTKDQIIQDMPVNDRQEQTFETFGMTEAEIEESRRNIRM